MRRRLTRDGRLGVTSDANTPLPQAAAQTSDQNQHHGTWAERAPTTHPAATSYNGWAASLIWRGA